jgi:hypothetical protein
MSWRLKKKLTCGAYMSASGEREKQHRCFGPYGRCMRVQWTDSGSRHAKDVENAKDQVDKEL